MEKFCLDDHCKFFLMLMISTLTINECKSNELDFRDYYFKAHVRPAVNVEVYNDIRRALYFDGSDDTLNTFIRRTFDLRTSNPTYMFILPNKKHTTLVMKRSDFKRPIFPSMTKINVKLGRMSAMRLFENELTYGHLGVTTSILKMSAFDYDHGEDMAQENTQTERNFIDYISRINEKAKELVQSRKMIQSSSFTNYHASYFPIMFRPDDLEWRKFGLFSWKEEVIPSENFNEQIICKKLPIRDFALGRAELHKAGKIEDDSSMIPMQWIFLDDLNDQITWDLPGKIKGAKPPTKSQFNEIPKIMKNLLNSSVSPSWPITQPRNEHRNKNVYIARANDPFGYSTKWEFRPKSNVTGSRPKRGVGELYSMLKCSTGCDPLLLKGYGCYCGFLGAGIPADGIDRCCQAHDQCYGRTNCPGYLQYFVPYIWKCYNGRPLCAVDNGEWGRCATQLCKCDLSLSKCARKYRCPRRRAICHSNKLRLLQNYLKVI